MIFFTPLTQAEYKLDLHPDHIFSVICAYCPLSAWCSGASARKGIVNLTRPAEFCGQCQNAGGVSSK